MDVYFPSCPTFCSRDNTYALTHTHSVAVATTQALDNEHTALGSTWAFDNATGTLTFGSNDAGSNSINSVNLVQNDRVLVKDQTDLIQNGVYTVTTEGSAGTATLLTRVTGLDTALEFDGNTSVLDTATGKSYTVGSISTLGTDDIVIIEQTTEKVLFTQQTTFDVVDSTGIEAGAIICIESSIDFCKNELVHVTNVTGSRITVNRNIGLNPSAYEFESNAKLTYFSDLEDILTLSLIHI